MANTDVEADAAAREEERRPSPVIEEVTRHKTESYVALLGHPLHGQTVHFPIALVFATLGADIFYWYSGDTFWLRAGLWASGFAFFAGLAAGFFGTMELLLVKGIRVRIASWTHAVAAITLIAIAGTNWGVRITDIDDTLPHGLMLSVLAALMTGLAGWHGGKLVYDHGIGIFISSKK
jgi:uncharacterized membrane protein